MLIQLFSAIESVGTGIVPGKGEGGGGTTSLKVVICLTAPYFWECPLFLGMPLISGNAPYFWECPLFLEMPLISGNAPYFWECPLFLGMPLISGNAPYFWECPLFLTTVF